MSIKIGLFGGTFNPPHKVHIKLAKQFLTEYNLDKLYICPNNVPYHKSNENLVSSEHRFNMCKLSFSNLGSSVTVSDMEIKRGGYTYTIDTVNQILSENENCDKVYVLCGTDAIKSLPNWHNSQELCEKAIFVHAKRNQDYLPESIKTQPLDFQITDVSSSTVRDESKRALPSIYISEEVNDYILENLLYFKDKDYDLDDIKTYILNHEKESRYNHTLAVEECAIEIKNQVAPHLSDNLISTCALLHDCTKNFDFDEHFALLSTLDFSLSNEDLKNKKLLHSRSGAVLARRMFDVSDVVYNAIWKHTTGAEKMNILDKILYLADYIEKTRTFEDCIKLRNFYYEGLKSCETLSDKIKNLDIVLQTALQMTIDDLNKNNFEVHSDTVKANNYIKNKLKIIETSEG